MSEGKKMTLEEEKDALLKECLSCLNELKLQYLQKSRYQNTYQIAIAIEALFEKERLIKSAS